MNPKKPTYEELATENERLRKLLKDKEKTENELTKAKERAEKSESIFKEAQELAKIGNWELDIVNNNLYWSDEVYRIFGCKPREFEETYEAFLSFIHPKDRDYVDSAYSKHIKTQSEYNIVHRIKLKNGSIKFVNERCRTDFDENDKPLRSVGTVADITDRVFTQNQLKEARIQVEEVEEKHRFLFDNTSQGVVYHDASGKIIYANYTAACILGLSLEQLQGKTSLHPRWKAVHEDGSDYPGDTHPVMISLKTGEPLKDVKMGIYFPDLEIYRWLNINSIPVFRSGETKPFQVTVIFDDITEIKNKTEELKRAKQKAEESERRYHDLYDNSPDMYLSVDSNSARIINCNNTLTEQLLYSREELIGMEVFNLFAPESVEYSRTKVFPQFQQTGIVKNEELKVLTKDGRKIDVLINVNAVRDKKGNILYTRSFWREITQFNKAQRELKIAKEKAEESNRLKTAFLQNLSHEIRTPLNAIMGFSDMLGGKDLPAAKRKDYTSIIIENSKQLLSILNDILTISSLETRQESLFPEEVCINDVINNLFEEHFLQARRRKIALYKSMGLGNEDSKVIIDKTKLVQILANLLTNAIKFTSTGKVEFGYKQVEYNLEFFVKDTGKGIPKSLQETIFERFRQGELEISARLGGTGLGLAICKGFVSLLGGKIWVDSVENEGAVFYFTIPYKPIAKFEQKILGVKAPSVASVVLVAEDEEFNFIFINEVLSSINIKVLHAKDGNLAIEQCKAHPEINLVFMDIKMPNLDGYSATKAIKELRPDLPIIAQTAYALKNEVEKYKDVFDGFLTKPLRKKDIIGAVSKYFIQA